MVDIFNRIYEAQEIARIMHLQAVNRKESVHVALEEFYKSLSDKLDMFLEIYQGQFDIVDNFGEFKKVDTSDPIKYFKGFVEDVSGFKMKNIPTTSHFDTIYDDIIIMTYRLLYKLRFLN